MNIFIALCLIISTLYAVFIVKNINKFMEKQKNHGFSMRKNKRKK